MLLQYLKLVPNPRATAKACNTVFNLTRKTITHKHVIDPVRAESLYSL